MSVLCGGKDSHFPELNEWNKVDQRGFGVD